jgi:hypothetical protein
MISSINEQLLRIPESKALEYGHLPATTGRSVVSSVSVRLRSWSVIDMSRAESHKRTTRRTLRGAATRMKSAPARLLLSKYEGR